MLKKFKVLIVIASLAITLSLMSNTYSRYVASSAGNVNIEFAKWQLLVNSTDITDGTSSTISFEPTIMSNTHVAENKVAPASIGYFDVEIDPTNVDVSFNYKIELGIEGAEEVKDLTITKYAILPENYIEGNGLQETTITDGIISNTKEYVSGGFKKFTIRIFFQWFEGEDEILDDTADTNIGIAAADENTSFKINANIKFEQYLGETTTNSNNLEQNIQQESTIIENQTIEQNNVQ